MWDDAAILALRPAKNAVRTDQPYAFFVEPERTRKGAVEEVATILLTNRECPFRCLMCDLWKNTTDSRVSVGSIPTQIEYALCACNPCITSSCITPAISSTLRPYLQRMYRPSASSLPV